MGRLQPRFKSHERSVATRSPAERYDAAMRHFLFKRYGPAEDRCRRALTQLPEIQEIFVVVRIASDGRGDQIDGQIQPVGLPVNQAKKMERVRVARIMGSAGSEPCSGFRRRLAFSLERHDGDGFIIGEGRRYAHSAPYVRTSIEAAGLVVLQLEQHSARCEAGVPVPGLVIAAEKIDAH